MNLVLEIKIGKTLNVFRQESQPDFLTIVLFKTSLLEFISGDGFLLSDVRGTTHNVLCSINYYSKFLFDYKCSYHLEGIRKKHVSIGTENRFFEYDFDRLSKVILFLNKSKVGLNQDNFRLYQKQKGILLPIAGDYTT